MAYYTKIDIKHVAIAPRDRNRLWLLVNEQGVMELASAAHHDESVATVTITSTSPNEVTKDLREWSKRNGVGDWDSIGLSANDEVIWVVPKHFAVSDQFNEAFRTICKTVTAYGAKVHSITLEPGQTVASQAISGDLRQSLDNQRTAPDAAPADDRQVSLDTRDRGLVLQNTVEAVLAANRSNKSLFLSKAALVSVFEGAILPVDTIAKFRGWCQLNGIRFHTTNSSGETVFHFAADDISQICVQTPAVWNGSMFPLRSISTLPFVRNDGSFISEPGYDETLQVFIADDNVGQFAQLVPDDPDQDEAQLAANWLLTEVFGDFPFVSDADRANALGLIVTALTRYIYHRPTPLFGITAPDSGTGKGLLTDVISLILQGQAPDLKVLSDSDEEQRKVITGTLMESANPVVVWDNVKTGSKVSSRVLCALHTSETWTDRVLGSSSSVTLANDRIWIATGNNIGPADDMVRRWVRIALDAGVPHPEERTGFRHKDLKAWVLEHRSECVVAVMTMIRAWYQAGKPQPDTKLVVGDYQPILNTVGGILEYAGVTGFMANQDEVRAKAAEGSVEEIAEEFLHWLSGALYVVGRDPARFSTGHIGEAIAAFDGSLASAALSEVPLPPTVAACLGKGKTSVSRALSHWMSEMEGRRFGEEKFRLIRLKDQKIDRGQAWALYVDSGKSVDPHPLVSQYQRRSNRQY